MVSLSSYAFPSSESSGELDDNVDIASSDEEPELRETAPSIISLETVNTEDGEDEDQQEVLDEELENDEEDELEDERGEIEDDRVAEFIDRGIEHFYIGEDDHSRRAAAAQPIAGPLRGFVQLRLLNVALLAVLGLAVMRLLSTRATQYLEEAEIIRLKDQLLRKSNNTYLSLCPVCRENLYRGQLIEKDDINREMDQILRKRDEMLIKKDEMLRKKDQMLHHMLREKIRLAEDLQLKSEETTRLRHNVSNLNTQVVELMEHITEKDTTSRYHLLGALAVGASGAFGLSGLSSWAVAPILDAISASPNTGPLTAVASLATQPSEWQNLVAYVGKTHVAPYLISNTLSGALHSTKSHLAALQDAALDRTIEYEKAQAQLKQLQVIELQQREALHEENLRVQNLQSQLRERSEELQQASADVQEERQFSLQQREALFHERSIVQGLQAQLRDYGQQLQQKQAVVERQADELELEQERAENLQARFVAQAQEFQENLQAQARQLQREQMNSQSLQSKLEELQVEVQGHEGVIESQQTAMQELQAQLQQLRGQAQLQQLREQDSSDSLLRAQAEIQQIREQAQLHQLLEQAKLQQLRQQDAATQEAMRQAQAILRQELQEERRQKERWQTQAHNLKQDLTSLQGQQCSIM